MFPSQLGQTYTVSSSTKVATFTINRAGMLGVHAWSGDGNKECTPPTTWIWMAELSTTTNQTKYYHIMPIFHVAKGHHQLQSSRRSVASFSRLHLHVEKPRKWNV
jgi:hypothetical protein